MSSTHDPLDDIERFMKGALPLFDCLLKYASFAALGLIEPPLNKLAFSEGISA